MVLCIVQRINRKSPAEQCNMIPYINIVYLLSPQTGKITKFCWKFAKFNRKYVDKRHENCTVGMSGIDLTGSPFLLTRQCN